MVKHIIRAEISLIARIFLRRYGARKNTTQLAKYPRVLYVKPSNKVYILSTKMVGIRINKKSRPGNSNISILQGFLIRQLSFHSRLLDMGQVQPTRRYASRWLSTILYPTRTRGIIVKYHIISYHIISYHIISYHIISYHIISYHILSYHIMSCHVMSCHVMSCHVISIISYHISY